MKKAKLNILFISILLLLNSSFGYAVSIVNYYKDTLRVEIEDCKTFEQYQAFPSTQSWFGPDLSQKVKYLFIDTIKNGYYSNITGSNIPKKLCVYAFNPKNKKNSAIIKVSSYSSCYINFVDDEMGTGFKFDISYDCHYQDLL